MSISMETIVNLAKRRGFVFPSSELYGGLSGFYDWGPYGVELKNNIKRAWWKWTVERHKNVVGLDSALILNPKVWQASGHVANFADLMVDCKSCKHRFRADHLLAGINQHLKDETGKAAIEYKSVKEGLKGISCPVCGRPKLTEPRPFNLMFKTFVGPAEDSAHVAYLRPETAQGIFINFANVAESTRAKLPFGIAQIGKSFRNEITPGDFVFRVRELEQMELEYFTKPKEAAKWFKYWLEYRQKWFTSFGINKKNLRYRPHGSDELAHYAKEGGDIEYSFPMGWKELEGVMNRSDFDLKAHAKASGKDLSYFDEEEKVRFTPYVIEPAVGVERTALAFLVDAYREEDAPTSEGEKEKRVVLKLHHEIAPIKVAVLPLSKKPELSKLVTSVWEEVSGEYRSEYDETQSIGKRYRRQDEIGTPYCVTVDFDSLKDKAVTVRDRDSMKQKRVKIKELMEYLMDKFK